VILNLNSKFGKYTVRPGLTPYVQFTNAAFSVFPPLWFEALVEGYGQIGYLFVAFNGSYFGICGNSSGE
jgi:hypothetical protein